MTEFQIINNLPTTLTHGAIERAVRQFVDDIEDPKVPRDKDGLVIQLLTYIGHCLIAKIMPQAQVWIAEDDDKEIAAFALTHWEMNVDNKPTLWLSTAWVRRNHRFTSKPKEWFHRMEEYGKIMGAKHLLIPSARGYKGYLRYIGQGWHKYEVILKKDL